MPLSPTQMTAGALALTLPALVLAKLLARRVTN